MIRSEHVIRIAEQNTHHDFVATDAVQCRRARRYPAEKVCLGTELDTDGHRILADRNPTGIVKILAGRCVQFRTSIVARLRKNLIEAELAHGLKSSRMYRLFHQDCLSRLPNSRLPALSLDAIIPRT